MGDMPLTYIGMRVILTDGGSFQPVRVHNKNVNQSKTSYHKRIQKKWLKRFGERWVEIQKRGEVFILNNQSVIIRKDDWPALTTI